MALRAIASMAVGSTLVVACLVGVDEGLLTRGQDAGTADGGDPGASDGGDGGSADAPDPNYLGLPCGNGPCQVPTQVCCATSNGDTDVRRGHCDTSRDCPTGDYFACSRPLDCQMADSGGLQCCVVQGSSLRATCQATCDSRATQLCDPNAPSCPVGRACKASATYTTLYECVAN